MATERADAALLRRGADAAAGTAAVLEGRHGTPLTWGGGRAVAAGCVPVLSRLVGALPKASGRGTAGGSAGATADDAAAAAAGRSFVAPTLDTPGFLRVCTCETKGAVPFPLQPTEGRGLATTILANLQAAGGATAASLLLS